MPLDNPPVNVVKIAIGNGFIGSYATNREIPVVSYPVSRLILAVRLTIGPGHSSRIFPRAHRIRSRRLQLFQVAVRHIIFRGIPVSCLQSDRHHLCGFDLNLTYPQTGGTFPPQIVTSGQIANQTAKQALFTTSSRKQYSEYAARMHSYPDMRRADALERREEARSQWKRDLTGRPNGTIDPWYGCDVWQEMWDYAFNFTIPWSACQCFLPLCRVAHIRIHC